MKNGLWILFVLAVLPSVDVFACGDPTSPNGCSPELKYVWKADFPDMWGEKIEAFNDFLEKYPMRALFDQDPKTFWMTGVPFSEKKGINWFLQSNFDPLTVEMVRIDGTCQIQGGHFQDQNRVKKITLKIGKKEKSFLLKDKQGVQEFSLKRLDKSKEWDVTVEKIYPGKKNKNTCITSLQFVTKESGAWPKPPRYLFETVPGEYVYPSYSIIYEGKIRGAISGYGSSFYFHRDGSVVISDSEASGFLFGHFSDLQGRFRMDEINAKNLPKKISYFDFDSKPFLDVAWASWSDENHLCVSRIAIEIPESSKSAFFHLYQKKGRKLKLLKEVKVPTEEACEAWREDTLAKYCPKLN